MPAGIIINFVWENSVFTQYQDRLFPPFNLGLGSPSSWNWAWGNNRTGSCCNSGFDPNSGSGVELHLLFALSTAFFPCLPDFTASGPLPSASSPCLPPKPHCLPLLWCWPVPSVHQPGAWSMCLLWPGSGGSCGQSCYCPGSLEQARTSCPGLEPPKHCHCRCY